MSRDEFKRTAVRLPVHLYDDLSELSRIYGLSHNGLMVEAIGRYIDIEKRRRKAFDDYLKSHSDILLSK